MGGHHFEWCRYVHMVRVSKYSCNRFLLFFSSLGLQLRPDQFKFTHGLYELQRQDSLYFNYGCLKVLLTSSGIMSLRYFAAYCSQGFIQ